MFKAWLNFFKFKQIRPGFSFKFSSFSNLGTLRVGCRFCKIQINFGKPFLRWQFLLLLRFLIAIETLKFIISLICFRANICFCIFLRNLNYRLRWLLIYRSLWWSFINIDRFGARKFTYPLVGHISLIAVFLLDLIPYRSTRFSFFLSNLSLVLVPCCFPCDCLQHLRLKPTSMKLNVLLQFFFQLVVLFNSL